METAAETGDLALIAACLAGDQAAWSRLVDKYARLVFSIARRTGLSDADADDVLQIVFTTLYRRLPGLRDQAKLSSWLITTTSREAWRAGKVASRSSELDESLADTRDLPADLVARAERDQLVREAVGQLDVRCRDLLTALFLSDDPPYTEIAGQLGIAVGSIGPTRARCFKKLEGLLRDSGVSNLG
jgi:RNA polymerase sigma factor (sigma-70 family)